MNSIHDFDVNGKKVLVRVDYNVPIKNGKVLDRTRIIASLPTLNYLLRKGAILILMSHLGRPEGKFDKDYSLKPVRKELRKLLPGAYFFEDCIGDELEDFAEQLVPGDVLLLENLRFYKEEEENDTGFASKLAELADFYVNDAFGVAHRAHASVDAITHFLPSAPGFLLEKEIKELSLLLKPKKPFVCLLGGVKISEKLKMVESLARKANKVLVGGAMASTFLKAKGYETGLSKVESVDLAGKLLKKYKNIVLPVDVVVEDETVNVNDVPKNKSIFDIGPKTCKMFQKELRKAKTIFWNGPLGLFENKKFAKGTKCVAKYISALKSIRIVGGGDSVELINRLKLASKFTYVSAGGGASLEFLSGKKLPAIAALERRCGM